MRFFGYNTQSPYKRSALLKEVNERIDNATSGLEDISQITRSYESMFGSYDNNPHYFRSYHFGEAAKQRSELRAVKRLLLDIYKQRPYSIVEQLPTLKIAFFYRLRTSIKVIMTEFVKTPKSACRAFIAHDFYQVYEHAVVRLLIEGHHLDAFKQLYRMVALKKPKALDSLKKECISKIRLHATSAAHKVAFHTAMSGIDQQLKEMRTQAKVTFIKGAIFKQGKNCTMSPFFQPHNNSIQKETEPNTIAADKHILKMITGLV